MSIRSRAATLAAHFTLAACALAGITAYAASNRQGEVIIDADSNVVLAGGSVSPGRPVSGNFVGMGGSVVVDQPVGENAAAAGGSIAVRAPVGANLGAAGGVVKVEAPVGGNFGGAGGEVTIAGTGTISEDADIHAATITIDGRVAGNLRATAERLVINGEVGGNVQAAASQVVLGPKAKIGGELQYLAAAALTREPGSVVGGAVSPLDEGAARRAWHTRAVRSPGLSLTATVITFFILLGCGALFISAAPIFSVEAPEGVGSRPLRSIGMGLVTIIGTPIVAALFVVTIVGIPVSVLLVALFPFALLLGFLVGTLWVASFVPRVLRWPPPPTVRAAIGHFAIALAVVLLLAKVPVAGGWLVCALIVAGAGAFEVQLYRRMRSGSRAMAGRVEVVRP